MGNGAALSGGGNLTLNGGTLAGSAGYPLADGSISGAVLAGSGASFISPGGGGIGILAVGGLTLNSNAQIRFDIAGSASFDQIIDSGALAFSGSGAAQLLVPSGLSGGSYELIGFGSSNVANTGDFSLALIGGAGRLNGYSLALSGSGLYLNVVPAFSGSAVWTSSPGNTLWSGTNNWTDGNGLHGVPGLNGASGHDTAILSNSSTVNSISLSGVNPNLMALDFNSADYTLTGGSLTLQSSTGTATITTSSGTQMIGVLVDLASSADMVVGGNGNELMISGQIVGNNPLLKDGAGTLVLSAGNNEFDGTVVNAGTLLVTSPGALPNGSSLSVGADSEFLFDVSLPDSRMADGDPQGVASPAVVATGVPEPGTLALWIAALGMWSGTVRRTSCGRTAHRVCLLLSAKRRSRIKSRK